jgi:mannose-6-phosphate isomerase
MTIEHAVVQIKRKPWGSNDLLPWSDAATNDGPVGELWFQRPDVAATDTVLLFKLVFTTEPLSIQVHPDDAFARSIGLANGKTEAWYILSAAPGARVAVGLQYPLSSVEFRTAIADGSIASIVRWNQVRKGDVIFVPAGTIHAIGADIVLAEIQQRSDATFRLFDYGRQRDLHIEKAIAAANPGPAEDQSPSEKLTEGRTALIVNPHFVLEQLDFLPGSVWTLDAPKETWILIIEGGAQIGLTKLSLGNAVFLEADQAEIEAGPHGLKALLAYSGPKVNSDGLNEASTTGANTARSRAPAVQTASEHTLPKLQETRTWPL